MHEVTYVRLLQQASRRKSRIKEKSILDLDLFIKHKKRMTSVVGAALTDDVVEEELERTGSLKILQHTFKGSNEMYEIETFKEFQERLKELVPDKETGKKSLLGWTLQQVDLTALTEEEWAALDWNGAALWGCTLPSHAAKCELEAMGATVMEQPKGVPFLAIRAHMYRNPELQFIDKEVYEWYLKARGVREQILQAVHDFSVLDALYDYLENKTVVVIMGGHNTGRSTQSYKDAAHLAYRLANEGFIIATGGGPGSMEAANLGAYMAGRTVAELDDALAIVGAEKDPTAEQEYNDLKPPLSVIAKYGNPTWQPSVGVPTYKYGHEPPSVFPTWQAKCFQNSVREDGLIDIGNGGIIYMPGGAGTRQEVFQAACKNHYAEEGFAVPMLFYDKTFWDASGIYNALEINSRGRPMAKWINISDSILDIIKDVKRFARHNKLPLSSLKKLQAEHEKLYDKVDDVWSKYYDEIILPPEENGVCFSADDNGSNGIEDYGQDGNVTVITTTTLGESDQPVQQNGTITTSGTNGSSSLNLTAGVGVGGGGGGAGSGILKRLRSCAMTSAVPERKRKRIEAHQEKTKAIHRMRAMEVPLNLSNG